MKSLDDQIFKSELIERVKDPKTWERWQKQMQSCGYCQRPVKLKDLQTKQIILKACGNRREAVCKPCSRIYKGDMWQLTAAGIRGGKSVPKTVSKHPIVFATFTAPSFGKTHHAQSEHCYPRRAPVTCSHGVKLACWKKHQPSDSCVGTPLCIDCFQYEKAVLWNALAPELWRRTTIYLKRSLAHLAGRTQTELNKEIKLSYLKVAEYQQRGSLHFHSIIRLDAIALGGEIQPPDHPFTTDLLRQSIEHTATAVTAPIPASKSVIRWGKQLDIQPIQLQYGTSPQKAAAYIAKYATKTTEALSPNESENTAKTEHLKRYHQAAYTLSENRSFAELKLDRTLQQLGFKGHWSTKSRGYSTTLTKLREERAKHRRSQTSERQWQYQGIGQLTKTDRLLTQTLHRETINEKKIAKEEATKRNTQ